MFFDSLNVVAGVRGDHRSVKRECLNYSKIREQMLKWRLYRLLLFIPFHVFTWPRKLKKENAVTGVFSRYCFVPCQRGLKYADSISCKRVNIPSKMWCINMILNCVWWWVSGSEAMGSIEFSFITITRSNWSVCKLFLLDKTVCNYITVSRKKS